MVIGNTPSYNAPDTFQNADKKFYCWFKGWIRPTRFKKEVGLKKPGNISIYLFLIQYIYGKKIKRLWQAMKSIQSSLTMEEISSQPTL